MKKLILILLLALLVGPAALPEAQAAGQPAFRAKSQSQIIILKKRHKRHHRRHRRHHHRRILRHRRVTAIALARPVA